MRKSILEFGNELHMEVSSREWVPWGRHFFDQISASGCTYHIPSVKTLKIMMTLAYDLI